MTNAEHYEFLREIIRSQTTTFGAAPPLCVFLAGPAGCGKTFVLRLVMDVSNRYNDAVPHYAFVICANTGKEAVEVGGTTVDSAFKLSYSKVRNAGLSDSELNTFRVAFRHVKYVILNYQRSHKNSYSAFWTVFESSDPLHAYQCATKQSFIAQHKSNQHKPQPMTYR
ncbi:hypothetical protein HPB50_011602 [Hyalomma asiaticum]|uniref:Uncharacterized protein n=1 Tax=Hyalomma asiaticum TaxID=266040 RepID=A0ACB7T7K1_HYAAI|nr:hypothetical protein HPB50_011602 [Hyalomma asiaticum]